MNDNYKLMDKRRKLYAVMGLMGTFIAGLGYTWSVLQLSFVQRLGGEEVKPTVVLCYTVTIIASTLTPSLFGGIIKKLNVQKTVFIGALLFSCGYIIAGRTTNMIVFYISCGLGTGIGSGFIYPTIMGYLATIYSDKRGAISSATAGIYGGASIIWSPFIATIIEKSSITIACLCIGIISILVLAAVAVILRPAPAGYSSYKDPKTEVRANAETTDLNRKQMIRTKSFYLAIATFSFGCTSGMMVISQISTIMQESFKLTATRAALYVSIMAFMSMAGRFIWGTLTDYFSKYIILCTICGLPVIAMGISACANSQTMVVVLLAVTALCYGGFGSTITPITATLFGGTYIGENYGVMYLAFGFAGLVGPQLSVNLSNNGDFTMAFIAAAAASSVAFALSLLLKRGR